VLVGIDLTTGAALHTARIDSGCIKIQVAQDRRMFVLNSDNSLTVLNSVTGNAEKAVRTVGFMRPRVTLTC
jgi:hypothetical protein